MRRPEVRWTRDFERIANLPRRTFTATDAEAWAEVLTAELRCAGSPAGTALLKWQGLALAEALDNNGALLGLPVGTGKTLIAELLPVVMRAHRAVLIVPTPGLRDKTIADRRAMLGVWRIANPPPRIFTLKELCLKQNEKLIDDFAPDLIVIDEADDLSNAGASVARRIDRYVLANPHVRVVCMTGTLMRNSIMGFWHLCMWALRERAPMPLKQGEAETWANVIDNKIRNPLSRTDPGPLGGDTMEARAWFAARLRDTPGVVIVDEDSAAHIPLTVNVRLAKECAELNKHFDRFVLEQENPAGISVSDPLSRWRIDAQLGAGYFEYWDPPPPEEWRVARRNLARFVRQTIERAASWSRPVDTESQVLSRFADDPIVEAWFAIKDVYDPKLHTRTAWVSSATIETAVAWFRESTAPGIVWCGGVPFAEALTAATRLPYYGEKGRDQQGRALHSAPVENIICSWNANKKGFNLQPWRRMLIVQPPQSAKWLEQIFGRPHRQGQTQPVTIDVLATSGGILDGFETSLSEARASKDISSLTQKIMRATINRARPCKTEANSYRWATRRKDKGKAFTISFGA